MDGRRAALFVTGSTVIARMIGLICGIFGKSSAITKKKKKSSKTLFIFALWTTHRLPGHRGGMELCFQLLAYGS